MNALAPIQIVGGGLAGLSLGLALRRAGVPVALHEASDYPRHRVCGEFITGLTDATVARLGLGRILCDAERIAEMSWFIEDRCVGTYRLPALAYGISRYQLDARLSKAFVSAGGDLHLQSRWSDARAPAGLVHASGRRRTQASAWIGLKIHARGIALRSPVEMHLGNRSYAGLSQVEGGITNICGLFPRAQGVGRGAAFLLANLEATGLSAMAKRLAGVEFDPDSFCAVTAFDFDHRFIVHRDQINIGDAGAMIAPFTGNGMSMAFQGAELALPSVLAYARHDASWDQTVNTVNRALHRNFQLRLAAARCLHSFLLDPHRQRWFAALSRANLLPFRLLYAALH